MRISGIGHVLFGVAAAGLAILDLTYGHFAPVWEPLPAWLAFPEVWVYAVGAILLAASAGLFFARTALASAIFVGAYEAAWAVARMRPVVLKPLLVSSWYGFSEALGPCMGAWILCAVLCRPDDGPAMTGTTGMVSERAQRLARVLFGAACVVYGVAHFAYASYTAAMIPACLPARVGLAYLTGVAHVAAGLGLLVGVLPRLAATLEAIMMTLFGLLVWLPSFFAQPMPAWAAPAQNQWSETVVTILLVASAWIVAASLHRMPWGFASTDP